MDDLAFKAFLAEAADYNQSDWTPDTPEQIAERAAWMPAMIALQFEVKP